MFNPTKDKNKISSFNFDVMNACLDNICKGNFGIRANIQNADGTAHGDWSRSDGIGGFTIYTTGNFWERKNAAGTVMHELAHGCGAGNAFEPTDTERITRIIDGHVTSNYTSGQ
jgi:hypothetical protein